MRWIMKYWCENAIAAVMFGGVVYIIVRFAYFAPHPQRHRIDLYEGGKIIQTWHGKMMDSGTHLVYFIDDETGNMIGVRGTIVTTPEGER
jgi:hypothetical protein